MDRKAPRPAIEEALTAFADAENVRDVPEIGAPPAAAAEYLERHAAAVDALRDHLNAARDITWETDFSLGPSAPIPNLAAYMRTARVLVARALLRARNGDPDAWDDLRALSMLDRSLHQRPDLLSQLIALAIARRVTAVAWKLPAPAPAWLADYHAIDRRRLFLQGVQADTAALWGYVPSGYAGALQRWYLRASVTNLAIHQRETAVEMSRVTECGLDGKAYSEQRAAAIPKWNVVGQAAIPNLPWSRVLRYEAEREAVANALRVRAGEAVRERSRCSDGTWRFEGGRVAFSRAIAKTSDFDMPLSLLTR